MFLETLKVEDAAKLAGVSGTAIRLAIYEDRLDAVKCGGRILVLKNSLDRYTPRHYVNWNKSDV